MLSNYIHLHLHSEYSISDSIVRINSLIEKAYEYDMPSVAVTDKNNMFAMVKPHTWLMSRWLMAVKRPNTS